MSDDDRPSFLKVDRLAQAVEAARNRARAGADAPDQETRQRPSAETRPHSPADTDDPVQAPPEQSRRERASPEAPDKGSCDTGAAWPSEAGDDPGPTDPETLDAMGRHAPDAMPADARDAPDPEPPLLLTDPAVPPGGEETALADTAAPVEPPANPQIAAAPDPGAPVGPTLLSFRGAGNRSSGPGTLSGIDLDVAEGAVAALLGPRGAGKTALLRLAVGLDRPVAGEILFRGTRLSGLGPDRIAGLGIAYVPASGGSFAGLTVMENLRLSLQGRRLSRERAAWLRRTFPMLDPVWTTPAARLPGGTLRALDIARALVEPRRLYLLDRPADGFPADGRAALVAALRDRALQGASVVIAEDRPDLSRDLAQMAVVLSGGGIAWRGEMSDLNADAAAQARWFGRAIDAA